jgi:hypothetical protein
MLNHGGGGLIHGRKDTGEARGGRRPTARARSSVVDPKWP